MTTADRHSKPMCQAAEDFIDEKEEDLKCPFCEIYFEKWGLLKHHLVRHVSEARLGKDLTPVPCSRASVLCLPASNNDGGIASATAANDISCSSFNLLSDSGQGLPNDETCVVSEGSHEKSNEHPFLYFQNVIRTDDSHFISKRSSSEKETNLSEVRLGNDSITSRAHSNTVDVSMLNQVRLNPVIIDPLIASSLISPKTHQGFVVGSSSGVYDGHTPGQTIACNIMKLSHRPCINKLITNSDIADSSRSVITTPITCSPLTRTSIGTVHSTVRTSSSILTSSMSMKSDSVSNINVLPTSSLSQLTTIRAVPSLLPQVVVTSLAPCDEPLADCTIEESIDDPGFPLQNPSTNHMPRCGGKKLLQCVVRPFTNLQEMDQSQTSYLMPNSHCQTPALHATKSLSASETAPLMATPTPSQWTGGGPAAINADHALTLESSGSMPSISTELPSDAIAAPGLLSGAAAVGSVDTSADGDGVATTDVCVTDKKTNRKSQQCRTCRKFFPSRESMQQHQTEAHNKGRPFKCSECGRHFLSSHNLSTHRRHRHPSPAAAPPSPRCCDECGKSFSSKANLALHAKLHSGERPFLCTVCGARFSRKCTLVSHLAYHSGDRRFTCDRCGARFYTSHSLARHAKLHSGERSFVCEVCGSSYVTSSDLKRHQLSHGSVKPFACTTCTKTFARKHDLKVHERYHSGEFRHECPHCGKRFVEQSNYRRHLRQHTGEKPYGCQACTLHFSQLHHLKKHQLSCSGPMEGASTATTITLTAGPRTTRIGHLQKTNGCSECVIIGGRVSASEVEGV